MQIDKTQGHIMNDMESKMFLMCGESDRAFQKVVDALNEIGCTSFILSKEEIKQMFEEKRAKIWKPILLLRLCGKKQWTDLMK